MSGDGSMLDEFLTEAKEHLEAIESDLLAIDSEGPDDERVRRIFRAVHTIKGNAGFFGFKHTSTLAHRMEALLALAREHKLTLGSEHVDVLLHGVDILRLLLDAVGQGDGEGVAEALARIGALIDAARAVPAPPPARPTPASPRPTGLPRESPPRPARPAPSPRLPPREPPAAETRTARASFAATGHVSAQAEVAPAGSRGAPGTVRVRLDILDELMTLAGELVLVRNQQLQRLPGLDEEAVRTTIQRLDAVTTELQAAVVRTRMQPIGRILSKFTRVVRDLGGELGKRIRIEMSGEEVELDKTILETLTHPLTHIVRNCCDHGIEPPEEREAAGKDPTGLVRIGAAHEGGQIVVRVADDGRGIDPCTVRGKALSQEMRTAEELERMGPDELLSLVFEPGLTTTEDVSSVSGRGVGMDVVKTSVERLGGVVDLHSRVGQGTEIVLRVPLTLAIIPSLIVVSGGQRYAIPQVCVEEVVALRGDEVHTRIECGGTAEFYRLRDALLPMVRLRDVLDRPERFDEDVRAEITERERLRRVAGLREDREARAAGRRVHRRMIFAVLALGKTRYGLVVDDVVGMQEIVVKPLHRKLQELAIYAGATVLGDGGVALIIDALGVMRHAGVQFEGERVERSGRLPTGRPPRRDRRRLLLFASGEQEQFGVPLGRVRRIEPFDPERIERVAGREFVTIEGRSTAVVRLDRVLPVSEVERRDRMYLVLVRDASPPWGLLASRVVDIGTYELDVDQEAFRAEGVEATAIARGRMTLLLDIDVIARATGQQEEAS